MELSKGEKKRIFVALLNDYKQYEIGRRQTINLFSSYESRKKCFDNIEVAEKESYELLKKFADDLGEELPNYKVAILEDYIPTF
jgi:hypothetical protein